jgi:hypothetical protein
MAADAIKDTSDLAEESNRRFGTTESQMKLTMNAVRELAKAIGDRLNPVWREFLGLIKDTSLALAEFVRDAGDITTGAIEGIVKALKSGVKEIADTIGLDVSSAIMRMGRAVKEFYTGVPQGAYKPNLPTSPNTGRMAAMMSELDGTGLLRSMESGMTERTMDMQALGAEVEEVLDTMRQTADVEQASAAAADQKRGAVEDVLAKWRSTNDEAGKQKEIVEEIVDRFAEWRQQLESMEDFGGSMDAFRRGGQALAGLGTVENVSSEINQVVAESEQYLRNFTDRSALTFEEVGLLASDFWRGFGDLSRDAVQEVIDAVEDPKIRKALQEMLMGEQEGERRRGLAEAAAQVEGLGAAVGRLPGGFRAAATASKIAADIMRYAAAAAKGPWGWVELAISAVAEALGLMGDKAEEEAKGMAKVIDEIKDASSQWIDRITDDLLEFVKTGKLAIGDLAQYIADELFRIGVANLVVEPIVRTIGGALGFAKGGSMDRGRIIDHPEFFSHKTGIGLRGEAGSEVLLPAVRLPDGTMGVRGVGGGGVNVVINDNRRSGADVQVRRSGQDIEISIDDAVDGALGRMARDGRLDGLMGGYYGLRRTPA